MDSITKTKLTPAQIMSLTQQAFNQDVQEITELTDGYFNTAYKIDIVDGKTAVLKVAPQSNVGVMRYEDNLMEIEATVLQIASGINGVPAPSVLYRKQDSTIIENDFFFMEFVPGVPLDKLRPQLTREQEKSIASDLGVITKKLNGVIGPRFGSISQPEKQFSNWRDAFLCMIKDLLEDAADAHVLLPFSYDAIIRQVEAHGNILNAVESPSLVHKDLWSGNIFVDPDTLEITGIVDFERAVYGDYLLEPVCGFLLENKAFMKAYLGRTELTQEEILKTTLYKIYLFLIMVIECSYRQYSDDSQEKWARLQLAENLTAMSTYE
jgi:aminoglycoside phosphotransferase (APT) family kinase protein